MAISNEAISVEEINKWEQYVTNERNGVRVREQEEDRQYFLDNYPMPLIQDPKYQIRTGYVAGMINDVTTKLIGNNPRCFVKPRTDDNVKTKDAASRVAIEGNRWLKSWLRHLQNPYRRTFKTTNVTGEAWVYVVHDECLATYEGDWTKDMPDAIPVIPVFYDPLVVFHDPCEDVNGQPSRVIVKFKRLASDVLMNHPKWDYQYKRENEKVDYFLYVDKDVIYAEAGKRPLFKDALKENIWGLVPFAHIYSGWGIETDDKDPALLAYSRIRMDRNLIQEASTISSDIALSAHNRAHGKRKIIVPSGADIPDNMLADYVNAPDAISVVRMPEGGRMEDEDPLELGPQVYTHLGYIESKLNQGYPAVLRGAQFGSSGRQDTRGSEAALTFYDSPLENNNSLWANVLDMGMKICSTVPYMKPPKLNKGDTDSYCEITVDLSKNAGTVDTLRLAEGERLWKNGAIDITELHTGYMGMTKEESDIMQARVLVEIVKREHPAIRQMILEAVGQEIGASEELETAQASVGMEGKGVNPEGRIGSEGGAPRQGNIQTVEGAEMADVSGVHEIRQSPRV